MRYGRRHHLGVVALFFSLGGTSLAASAALSGSGTVIHGCYRVKGGALRVVAGSRRCGPGERPIRWNQTGPTGAAGATGSPGAAGADFTSNTTLASGQTESGTYAASVSGTFGFDAINFRIPLAGPTTNVRIVSGSPTVVCPGQQQAARGYLCIYEYAGVASFDSVSDLPDSRAATAASTGFLLEFSGSNGDSQGTWAITAP